MAALLGVVGVLVGALLAFFSQTAAEKRARGNLHRSSLARLERMCHDYLNEIITNRRLAKDASGAATKTALYWAFPHPFAVDPKFVSEILDMDMNNRTMTLNLEMTRYNRTIEALQRSHYDLQGVHLGGTLPLDVWREAAKMEAEHWKVIGEHLDVVEDHVLDVCVRSILLVRQYDSREARLQRLHGIRAASTWPLQESDVQEERKNFETRRQVQLEASRKEIEERARLREGRGLNERPS